jgi:predicted permease
MDGFTQEVRFAARRLTRSPAFTAATVITLALAIGANASLFVVVQHVVLNPLPFPQSDRLLSLQYSVPRVAAPPTTAMPLGLYYQYADRARSLAGIAIYRGDERTLTGNGEPLRLGVVLTSPSLASVLGVAPALGRWFTSEEGEPGAPPVAVLSHGLWTSRFGADPRVLGRSMTLNGVPTSVVGVMPASFSFPRQHQPVDLWIADQISRASGLGLFTHSGVARLREGAAVEQARAEMTALIGDLPQAYPGNGLAAALANTVKLSSAALPLKDAIIGNVARSLWILLGSVGLVLLLACANVANLFLVRSEARQREIAIRRVLGGGRRDVARFFLTESLLLAAAGCAIGLALAAGAVRLLLAYGPPTLPRLQEIRLDGVGMAVTVAISAVTALAFGAIPLLRAAPLASALNESGRGNTASAGRHRLRQLLMGGQVALALVVLIASGLMVRSFQQLRGTDIGFDPVRALTFRIGLPAGEYPTRAAVVATHQAILERLSAIPGVSSASATTSLPLTGGTYGNNIRVEGVVPPQDTLQPLAEFHAVGGGLAGVLGMRVLRGNDIQRGDVDRGETRVVVNQALVDAYLDGQDPIGKRIASGAANTPWLTITGVVANTPTMAINEPRPRPKLYLPMSISGGPEIPAAALLGPSAASIHYVVRSSVDPFSLMPRIRAAIDSTDPNLAMSQVGLLQDVVDRSSAQMAFTMALLIVAACVALMLGIVGVYGVMSYIVTQRTGEIGVRLALGERPGAIAATIVRQGGLVTLAGVAVGLAAALPGGRFIEALLFGVTARDPGVLAVAAVIVLLVALLACWLPARRASRLSPLEALRPDA